MSFKKDTHTKKIEHNLLMKILFSFQKFRIKKKYQQKKRKKHLIFLSNTPRLKMRWLKTLKVKISTLKIGLLTNKSLKQKT